MPSFQCTAAFLFAGAVVISRAQQTCHEQETCEDPSVLDTARGNVMVQVKRNVAAAVSPDSAASAVPVALGAAKAALADDMATTGASLRALHLEESRSCVSMTLQEMHLQSIRKYAAMLAAGHMSSRHKKKASAGDGALAKQTTPKRKHSLTAIAAQPSLEVTTALDPYTYPDTTAEATTEAATTKAPTTETAATEAPTTDAPTSEAPTTEAPATEAPTTMAATTDAATTEEGPSLESTSTNAPTTEAPTTEAPTTEPPVTEAPTTEAPATESPATTSPGIDCTQFDADGFKEVTSLCCPEKMEVFFTGLLLCTGRKVCSKPHVQGLMHWFTCVPDMDFQYMLTVINDGNPCKYWSPKGQTCPTLSVECEGEWCR